MPRKKMTKKRARLLADLEYLIGSNCYNGNIQNYGAGGAFYGEGRTFRYPLMTIDAEQGKKKTRGRVSADDPRELSTGYYSFGANRLHIMTALDEVLRYLEDNHDLKV